MSSDLAAAKRQLRRAMAERRQAVTATAARAENLTLGYLVSWGHLTVAEAEVSYSQSESRYHLIGDGRTRGILDFFVSWTGRAETEGLLREDGRRPLVHRHQGTWNENARRTRVDWDSAAAPRTEAEPPPDPEQVTPVPAASTRGTSDPFTVVLSVLDRLAASGRCEAEARIWDGRRRYDISVTHLGEETLTADRPWAYRGVATRCALDFERIGGFDERFSPWGFEDDDFSLRVHLAGYRARLAHARPLHRGGEDGGAVALPAAPLRDRGRVAARQVCLRATRGLSDSRGR